MLDRMLPPSAISSGYYFSYQFMVVTIPEYAWAQSWLLHSGGKVEGGL